MKFKIGDKVYSTQYGWGVVVSVTAAGFYPVEVKFENFESTTTYTTDGRYCDDCPVSLFHEEVDVEKLLQCKQAYHSNMEFITELLEDIKMLNMKLEEIDI